MKILNFKVTSDLIVNSLCTITIGVGVVDYTTNVLLNDLYVKYFKEEYNNGYPVALSTSLRKRYDTVVKDLKYTEFQKAFSIPFLVNDIKPINIGCLNTRTGCYIGIPSTYDFNTIEDISVSNVEDLKLQEYLNLLKDNTESGQKFMESLILSEPAKKYSIAREMILTDNYRIFIKSLSCPLTLIPLYALGDTLMNALPPNLIKIRILAFFLLCNFGVFFWLLIRNAIENFYQGDADEIVSNIGEEYILGGIEYNEKLIQRNLALQNIEPSNKKAILIETLHHKIKYLEHRLKKYNIENTETT